MRLKGTHEESSHGDEILEPCKDGVGAAGKRHEAKADEETDEAYSDVLQHSEHSTLVWQVLRAERSGKN